MSLLGGGVMKGENSTIKWFQFSSSLELPIFITCDLEQFPYVLSFLNSHQWNELSDQESKEASILAKKNLNSRILSIQEASGTVSRQIDSTMESDRFGLESVIPKDGYGVYRYRKHGLMVYSFASSEWQLGTFNNFGADEALMASRSIIARYLSWALASFGIVGFWGCPVEHGVVIMKQTDSQGESIWIDIMSKKIITIDGMDRISGRFNIIRLTSDFHGKNMKMSREELMGLLSNRCTYFDYAGLSVPVRQAIRSISGSIDGVLQLQKNFRPRTDLSL